MTAPALDASATPAPFVDEWTATVREIEADQRRIAQLTDSADIGREVAQTVMSYQKDFAQRLVELRNFTREYVDGLAGHVRQIDSEVEALAELIGGEESHLTEEDASDITKLAQGARVVVNQFLERASGLSDEQRGHLQEIIHLADKVERRVEEIVQDEGDEEPEAEDGAEETP